MPWMLRQSAMIFTTPSCSSLVITGSTVEVDIEEEFFPMIDIETGAPLHLPEQSEGFTIDRQHQLDLTEALRQGILMARGLSPLCRPDCKGLCPACGNNLNHGPCSCAGAPGDPRWGALKRRRSA